MGIPVPLYLYHTHFLSECKGTFSFLERFKKLYPTRH